MLIFFFFNDTATTEIYTLSLHDALPIYRRGPGGRVGPSPASRDLRGHGRGAVRLLHARLPARRERAARAERFAHARRDKGSPEREPLPLHGLHKNLRGGRAGRGAHARRRGRAAARERLRLRIDNEDERTKQRRRGAERSRREVRRRRGEI